jgi:MFS family permease
VALSGRIYDKVGPRPLMVGGFAILMVNTWQFSQIQANTSIGWIVFLLALRGLALGLTVQTTMVTALSVVARRDLPRGASLTNATRQVVQSIGVAVLATVLASAISPEIQALQQQFSQGPRPGNGQPAGICEPVPVAWVGATGAGRGSSFSNVATEPSVQKQGPTLPPQIGDMVQRACRENIAGFERAYTVTFYAAFVALLLGLLLPGWPAKWAGRQAVDVPGTPS